MRVCWFVFVLCCLSVVCSAQTSMPKAYDEGRAFGASKSQESASITQKGETKLVPGFESAMPKQTSYYQENAANLEGDSQMQGGEGAKFIRESKRERPHISFQPETDPLFIRSRGVAQDPHVVLAEAEEESGVAEGEVFTLHECSQGVRPQESTCTSSLDIKTRTIKGNLKYVYMCGDTVPPCNGRRNNGCACNGWTKVKFGYDCVATNKKNQCEGPPGWTGKRPYMWRDVGTPPPDEYEPDQTVIASEQWVENCQHLESLSDQGKCIYGGKRCTQGAATRVIIGLPIYRGCWEYTLTYLCESAASDPCKNLKNTKGCFQIGSNCTQRVNNECVAYKQTYKCPKDFQNNKQKKLKGTAKLFCLDGRCADSDYAANKDMAEVISKLQALKEMQTTMTGQPLHVFKGESKACSKNVLSFSDCCALSGGWGESINMTKCNAEEGLLSTQKSKNLCHLIGTHCAEKESITRACLRKKTSYCCFPTKLSKLIQEQRRNQLKLGWGSSEAPDCRGLTIEEISKIDFSKLDTTEIFSDVIDRYKPQRQGDELQKKTIKSIEGNMNSLKGSVKHAL